MAYFSSSLQSCSIVISSSIDCDASPKHSEYTRSHDIRGGQPSAIVGLYRKSSTNSVESGGSSNLTTVPGQSESTSPMEAASSRQPFEIDLCVLSFLREGLLGGREVESSP